MNFGQISKAANKIRRAIAQHFNLKAGAVSFKLCWAIAKNGGNEVTAINAINYNKSFKKEIIPVKGVALKMFAYYINGKFINLMKGTSEKSVRNALSDRFNCFWVQTIGVRECQ